MVTLTKNTNQYFLSYIIVILVFLATLNNIPINGLSQVGFLSILLVFIITLFALAKHLLKHDNLSKFHFWLIFLGFSYTAINITGFFQEHGMRFYVVSFQFVSLFTFFLTLTFIKWNINKLKFLSKIAVSLIIINFTLLASQRFPMHFSGLFVNPNSLGLFVFLIYFFYTVQGVKKRKVTWSVITIMSLTLIYFSSTRSIFLSFIFMFLTYLCWNIITKHKVIFISFFLTIVTSLISFIYVYPNMYKWDNFQYLNFLTWKYTGKNLLSGREIIWGNILDQLEKKMWMGYGAGATTNAIHGVELSAHNLYVQIAYQLGVVGLVLFMLILLTIWFGFWKGRKDNRVKLAAAFFVGILVQQSFEVTLIQNNMALALMQWLILGIGIGLSFRYTPQINNKVR